MWQFLSYWHPFKDLERLIQASQLVISWVAPVLVYYGYDHKELYVMGVGVFLITVFWVKIVYDFYQEYTQSQH